MTRYRDATYSADTQARLRELLAWLTDARLLRWQAALNDVVERWDANAATEIKS